MVGLTRMDTERVTLALQAVKNPCTLQFVCYNADTLPNTLSHKGLPVTLTRLFRNVQLICVLGTLAALGLPTVTAAQSAGPRGPKEVQPRLALSPKTTSATPA